MKYFTISTIKTAIEHLQDINPNWLLTAFVLAANDVGTDDFVELSKKRGTDKFLDRYFSGNRLDLPPKEKGNNLLRPRLKNIKWNTGPFAGDYMIQQDTKLWANGLSSRGYRELLKSGELEGSGTLVKLSDSFQDGFEEGLPDTFRFEYFLVWLYAFEGFPDEISNWQQLLDHFLADHLALTQFREAYSNRFRLGEPSLPWPETTHVRPENDTFIKELAPKLWAWLQAPRSHSTTPTPSLSDDDEVYATISAAIVNGESLAFLLAGAPGTGKTYSARLIASKIADNQKERMLYLQFHPGLSYDDFIEGFRPEQTDDGHGIFYKLDSR
uniref:AAA family ATPase n=1 Tax=Marinicauda pacifica TaxID=1133559 RepID=UPI0035C7DC21